MNDSTITLRGYVGADPELRRVGTEQVSVASFRVACTPRRLNRQTGEWADTTTQWYTVSAWRALGENVARSLRKGDPVVVQGRLIVRTYVNKDGLEVNTYEVEAGVVGHDLNRGATSLTKSPRSLAQVLEPTGTGLEGWPRTDEGGAEGREAGVSWGVPGDPRRADPWEEQPAALDGAGEPAEEAAVDAA